MAPEPRISTLSKDRIHFTQALGAEEVAALAANRDLRILQTRNPQDAETWNLLNENLFAARPDVQLRVFGFSRPCDLSFVGGMKNLRHFSADCLLDATGIEKVAELPNLESLSVGIYKLGDFDFLGRVPAGLRELFLGNTKSKRPRLAQLARFKNLTALYLEGQQNDLEVIGQLPALEDLTLRSVSPAGLDFVRNLGRLWSLDIKLGGLRDLSALAELGNIKYLELWRIRGLSDIRVISTLTGLQHLFLQDLTNVTEIPDLSRLNALRRLSIFNLKGLGDVAAVASAPALEELFHSDARGLEPDAYDSVLQKGVLKRATVAFGSLKKNQAFEKRAARHGVEPFKHAPFVFR